MDSDNLSYLALSSLVPSPLDVRKSGGENIDELASLIRSQTLLQNLIVTAQLTKRASPPGASRSSPEAGG